MESKSRTGRRCENCKEAAYIECQKLPGQPLMVVCPNCSFVATAAITQEEIDEKRVDATNAFIVAKSKQCAEETLAAIGNTSPHAIDLAYKPIFSALVDNWGCLGEIVGELVTQDEEHGTRAFGIPWWITNLTERMGAVASAAIEGHLTHPGAEFEAFTRTEGRPLSFEPSPADNVALRNAVLSLVATAMQIIVRIDLSLEQEEQEKAEAVKALELCRVSIQECLAAVYAGANEHRDPTEEEAQSINKGTMAVRLLAMSRRGVAILKEEGIVEEHPLYKASMHTMDPPDEAAPAPPPLRVLPGGAQMADADGGSVGDAGDPPALAEGPEEGTEEPSAQEKVRMVAQEGKCPHKNPGGVYCRRNAGHGGKHRYPRKQS